ncbi:hypothetical protein Arub01_05950 [Actinomadura rubrobrunea]|uniref:Uncharacterized protein n=1 Tax=Actinomadura rubrobrunea TaxID=115335 RepID=A0A9W6PSD4_9ACTN|nr:hypothetical protein [Actinomadura rubrobrunea]GLW62351.1 hypothetical protein Arub01_05950 [Actinomadura rubrobrunea]
MGESKVSLIKKPGAARPHRGDETTRALCAGVYLDPEFRDDVITQVHNAPRRRVPPSYGYDVVPVVTHAWRAWRLEALRDAAVLAVLIGGWSVRPPAFFAAVGGLVLWHLVGQVLRSASTVLRESTKTKLDDWLRRDVTRHDTNDLSRHKRTLLVSARGCLLAVIVTALTAGAYGLSLREAMASALPLLLLITAAVAFAEVQRARHLTALHRGGPVRPRRLGRRLKAIDDQQLHPLVVYSRPKPKDDSETLPSLDLSDTPSMFVGSGKLIHRWVPPLTIQLLKPAAPLPDHLPRHSANGSGRADMSDREHVTPPFDAHELVEHLKRKMKPIGLTADPVHLPGYSVTDRVFVCEDEITTDPVLLTGDFGREHMRRIIDAPPGVAHHFLEIRTTSSGELVTTVFLRVAIQGRSLCLDFAACALTRTPAEYHSPGSGPYTDGTPIRLVLRSLCDLPYHVVRSFRVAKAPLILLHTGFAMLQAKSTHRHGPLTASTFSVREHKAAEWKDSSLDRPTIEEQLKIIELRLLEATEDFLTAHNVDTSAFKKRAETIISASVLNMGGHVDINNSAVGGNAQIIHGGAAEAAAAASQGAQL